MEKFEHIAPPQEEQKEKKERPPVPEFLRGFSEKEKLSLIENLGSIELTRGCSVACKFCGYNAEPRVRGHIPFEDLEYIADSYSPELQNKKFFALYWASDPLDYESGNKDYADVVKLFKARGANPFTSTAYPKGKKELFKKLMAEGYIDRVSVSRQNLKRLEKEGWLAQEEEGVITTPHKAIRAGLNLRYDKDRNDVYKVAEDELYVSAGRALRAEKEALPGGIECEVGVMLRTDGFYNEVPCLPKKERPTGVILQKILPENLKRPIDLSNPPKTIDELIKYGLVSHREHELFDRYQYAILNNFASKAGKKYYAEYDVENLSVADIEEIKTDRDEKALQIYIEAKRAMAEIEKALSEPMYGTPDLTGTISMIMRRGGAITADMKKSPFYQKLIASTSENIEDLVTAPDWNTEHYKGYVSHDLSESNKDAEWNREDLREFVQGFKNAFILARDGVLKDDLKMADETEKKFMDKLYASLEAGILSPSVIRRLGSVQFRGTIAFLKKVFNKNNS
ncbi:hypothetical protein KJ885_02705 [Patescibacteria group bacterium]|nr:hypothetical protein [Patescibacteria group bacterium]